jgi:hypothetical protein
MAEMPIARIKVEPQDFSNRTPCAVHELMENGECLHCSYAELQAGAQAAAQPVSAPSPVTDGLQWQMWKGDNGLDYVDMRDYRTAREDRDRIEENCRILHGDNEGLIAHYRDQLIREREARKQEAVEQFNAGLEAAAMDSCSRCRSGIPLVEFDGHMYHEYHKGRDYRDCYSLGIRKLLKSVSGSPERLEGGK